MAPSHAHRAFLFLQGPHGPFFSHLGEMMANAGAQVWRVGFNRGDQRFWPDQSTYIAFNDTTENWPARIADLLDEKGITDLVLYGDTRPIHAQAIEHARAKGITVHVFEEGYLRPYWVTYERGGANGHSRLMDTSVAQMRNALKNLDLDLPDTPAKWGDMRQHVFYGALCAAGEPGLRQFSPTPSLNGPARIPPVPAPSGADAVLVAGSCAGHLPDQNRRVSLSSGAAATGPRCQLPGPWAV